MALCNTIKKNPGKRFLELKLKSTTNKKTPTHKTDTGLVIGL